MSVRELMGLMACYRYARCMKQRNVCITLTAPVHVPLLERFAKVRRTKLCINRFVRLDTTGV